MSKLPRTFCVTLKETPIRTRLFNEFASKSEVVAEPFYGIFGQRIGLLPKSPNEIECPGKNIFMTEGAVGCYLSHFVLWNVLQYLPEEEFLIVEDDARFVEGFKEKFFSCYNRLPPDWEMVYVGWLPWGDGKDRVVVDEGISIRHPSATHAYLIKKSILKKACEAIQPCGSPIDLLIANKFLPIIKYYVFDPPLVEQRSYLNTSDPVWNSLVYDWKNDLYGCREKLLKDFSLIEGWHAFEQNDIDVWKWSKDEFTIHLPEKIDAITLVCTTPIQNEIVFTVGEAELKMDLRVGTNRFQINTAGQSKIIGKMMAPFIPSKEDSKSFDDRSLGICLKHVVFHTGTTDVDLPLKALCASVPHALSFKL